MGIAERGYMRERPSKNVYRFGAPRPPRDPSVFTIVLVLVAVLYLVFNATQWWHVRSLNRAAALVRQAVANPPGPSASSAHRQHPQGFTAPQYDTPPAAGAVTKCVQNGKTSYSDSPCPSGAVVSTLSPPPPPVPVARPVVQLAPATTQAVAVQTPQVIAFQNQPAVNPFAERLAQCKALDSHITQLDNEARQLLSAQQQDWIKEVRKKARDRQFALHCQ